MKNGIFTCIIYHEFISCLFSLEPRMPTILQAHAFLMQNILGNINMFHSDCGQGRSLKFCLGGCKHALDRISVRIIFGPTVQPYA